MTPLVRPATSTGERTENFLVPFPGWPCAVAAQHFMPPARVRAQLSPSPAAIARAPLVRPATSTGVLLCVSRRGFGGVAELAVRVRAPQHQTPPPLRQRARVSRKPAGDADKWRRRLSCRSHPVRWRERGRRAARHTAGNATRAGTKVAFITGITICLSLDSSAGNLDHDRRVEQAGPEAPGRSEGRDLLDPEPPQVEPSRGDGRRDPAVELPGRRARAAPDSRHRADWRTVVEHRPGHARPALRGGRAFVDR